MFWKHLRAFLLDRRGNVAIVFAVMLPVILGVTALVAEYGNSLSIHAKNQRVADMASYAGALAYASSTSTANMIAAAKHVAVLNGVPADDVTVSLVTSPKTTTKKAVKALVAIDNPLFLSPILGTGVTVRISTLAYTEVTGAATANCILALTGGGTGVTLSGGTSITATACAVSSNATVSVPCGTKITAKAVTYDSSTAPSQPCTGITASSITKQTSTDPFASNTAIATANGRFTTLGTQTAPSAPTVTAPTGGTSIDFAYDPTTTKARAITIGCVAAVSGSTWTLTCPNGGTYNFANMTIGGGINLEFALTGTGTSKYNFSGNVSTSATTKFGPGTYTFGGTVTTNGTTTFGAGTYYFASNLTTNSASTTFGAGTFTMVKGITTGGGATTTFGAGTFTMGKNTTACNGAMFSICNTSTLTFGGPSTFRLAGGIYNGGGATLTMGSGTTNSFEFGPSSGGDSISLGGGSKTYLADATGGSSLFQMGGNINAPSGGGSCLVLSAAAQHDIKGFFNAAGAVVMGAGVYTIDGYYALGANGGGGAACTGYTVSVQAIGVTIVISGKTTPSSGSCASKAFCVAAGYSNIKLTAPTTGTYAQLAVIGPSGNANGATFTEGGSGGQVSGIFYFPKGGVTMSGGAGVSGGTNCLQLIGSFITLSGGTVLASECVTSGSTSGGGTPKLVQ